MHGQVRSNQRPVGPVTRRAVAELAKVPQRRETDGILANSATPAGNVKIVTSSDIACQFRTVRGSKHTQVHMPRTRSFASLMYFHAARAVFIPAGANVTVACQFLRREILENLGKLRIDVPTGTRRDIGCPSRDEE